MKSEGASTIKTSSLNKASSLFSMGPMLRRRAMGNMPQFFHHYHISKSCWRQRSDVRLAISYNVQWVGFKKKLNNCCSVNPNKHSPLPHGTSTTLFTWQEHLFLPLGRINHPYHSLSAQATTITSRHEHPPLPLGTSFHSYTWHKHPPLTLGT